MANTADFGVFGGSGFYDLLKNPETITVKTPFGPTSDKITQGEISGKRVAFLPRHGVGHKHPPHKIPYKANLFAFKKLGVKYIIAPCACGSLQPEIKPGDFLVCDQFVNFTHGRDNTYFHGPEVVHTSMADPYCPQLSEAVIGAAKRLKIKIWPKGTVVVIEGPRFSSRAESQFFTKMGWEVVNMTAFPECVLARELGMCYLNIALVTDNDAGLLGENGIKPVNFDQVLAVMEDNNDRVKKLIFELINSFNVKQSCSCAVMTPEAERLIAQG
ncbi:MAG TPA: S-methyl-5'-thioadenosine phosphorylase [bacterium]|nr:S-methyl-5'-thioadenosine phosphorylase [bacterium]